jgi:hypothetical protein
MAVDLARALYLKRGPVKIDRSVQFIRDSRYQPFDQADTTTLFHQFLKPIRASGQLKEVFDGIGLTALHAGGLNKLSLSRWRRQPKGPRSWVGYKV